MIDAGTRAVLAGCIVLLVIAPGPVLGQATADAQIEGFIYDGDGSVDLKEGGLHLWQSDTHAFTVGIAASEDVDVTVCLTTAPEAGGDSTELACEGTTVTGSGTTQVPVTIEQWPSNRAGAQAVSAVVESANGSTVLAETEMSVTVVRTDGDPDEDGLTNQREVAVGTDIDAADTDDDGLHDGIEVGTYETSPTTADTDGDGLSDFEEVETHGTDPTVTDSDDDGLPDDVEVERDTSPTGTDTDGDGLADGAEVNVYETNATTADTDDDGLDDGAEVETYETNPHRPDTDGDGLDDDLEVNTYGSDPNAVDTDGDGLEDGAEVNESRTNPTDEDTDDDGLTDGAEVNQHGTDPNAADTDGDGLEDGAEVNRHGTDPNAADTDDDGVNDRAEVRDGPLSGQSVPVVAVAGLLVVAVGGGVIVTRTELGPDVRLGHLLPVTVSLPGAESVARNDDGDGGDEEDSPVAGGRNDGSSGGAASTTAGDTDGSAVPLEFLSNEEQIHRLLEVHDGQIRQTAIVDETGWSKSKVSRVLSEMEAEEEIVKVDVGKGNLVTRPEDLPAGAKAPFEE